MSTPPRFGEQALSEALARIAAKIGADAFDARLLRLANNAVFALPGAGLVIRITLSHRLHDRARKNAELGAWFDEVDARTIRLANTPIPQPIAEGKLLATVWTYVRPHEPQPDGGDLGDALHAYHGLGLPPFPLPAWDPVGDARVRITDAECLGEDDRAYPLDWCERLEPRLRDYVASTPTGLVHADAHAGNAPTVEDHLVPHSHRLRAAAGRRPRPHQPDRRHGHRR
ncbi:phosphotransferase [Actinoplanes flavus]|uniref:Phosphotransferase n=1 Tax=Actinoplanes flavus TaxID=2820290 RepID=A0ABS3UZL5_9ACTN|nr:phosphotransferase [Actinoplanes flavus]MBO3744017.1 phosphotransferase [Actinoplanes flavus]